MDIKSNNTFTPDPRDVIYNIEDITYGVCLSCGKQVPSEELSKISTCLGCSDTQMFI
jgi:RNA polymerase-binding transcription factor DksA